MNLNDVLGLVQAGFTADEIRAMNAPSAAPAPAPAAAPAPETVPEEPRPPEAVTSYNPALFMKDFKDMMDGYITTMKGLNVASTQLSPTKTETVEDILASIIRPPRNEK